MRKVAIVTGGSGGIGRCTALALARAGCRVYEFSRHDKGGAGDVLHVTADMTDEASVQAAVAEVERREGRIDVLVCNAGFGISGAAEYTNPEDAHAQLELNLYGADRAARAVIPIMRAQGGGRIVCMSSIAGILPIPFQLWYSGGDKRLCAGPAKRAAALRHKRLRRHAWRHSLGLHGKPEKDAQGGRLRRARGPQRRAYGARRGDGHEPGGSRRLHSENSAQNGQPPAHSPRPALQGRRHGRKAAAKALFQPHNRQNVRKIA